ncbi:MAG TPA: hypothetical protein V6C90_10715 [Coleofasciculaceae cyanobacterium]
MTNAMPLRSRVTGNCYARFWRAVALARESLTLIINIERVENLEPTGKAIGLDMGLNHFYSNCLGG